MSIRTSCRSVSAGAMRLAMATVFAASAMLPAATLPAQAFDGGFTDCQAPAVLNFIQKRFVWTDQNVLKRGLEIYGFQNPRQNRVVPAGYGKPIGRLYCHATARMNDGHKRDMWYLIEEGVGYAGVGNHVEFCISGLDPWKIYGAWCRSVR